MLVKNKWLLAFLMIPSLLGGTGHVRAELAIANCLEEAEHVGVASGSTAAEAQASAISACIARGGNNACCQVYALIVKGSSGAANVCLAGAQGASGDFGYGIGSTKARATQSAVSNCRDGAIEGRYCKQKGTVSCQSNQK